MDPRRNPDIVELLDSQSGLLTRSQALGAGLTPRRLAYLTRPGGPFVRVLPRVFSSVTGELTTRQRLVAGLLYAGPEAVLTGAGALELLGVRPSAPLAWRPEPLVHVLLPHGSRLQGFGFVRVSRTRHPIVPRLVRGLPVAQPARVLADACRCLGDLREVRALVAATVQSGVVDATVLAGLVRELRGSAGPLLPTVVAEVSAGARSAPEAELLYLVRHCAAGPPLVNPELVLSTGRRVRPDLYWPHLRLAVEVDSRAWHSDPNRWEATLARHAEMMADGISVLHFTPRQIRATPGRVVRQIEASAAARTPTGQSARTPTGQSAHRQ